MHVPALNEYLSFQTLVEIANKYVFSQRYSRILGMRELFLYFSSKLNFYRGENFLKNNLAALDLLPYSTVYCVLRGIDVDVCCGR
jgi:hypothetical protein